MATSPKQPQPSEDGCLAKAGPWLEHLIAALDADADKQELFRSDKATALGMLSNAAGATVKLGLQSPGAPTALAALASISTGNVHLELSFSNQPEDVDADTALQDLFGRVATAKEHPASSKVQLRAVHQLTLRGKPDLPGTPLTSLVPPSLALLFPNLQQLNLVNMHITNLLPPSQATPHQLKPLTQLSLTDIVWDPAITAQQVDLHLSAACPSLSSTTLSITSLQLYERYESRVTDTTKQGLPGAASAAKLATQLTALSAGPFPDTSSASYECIAPYLLPPAACPVFPQLSSVTMPWSCMEPEDLEALAGVAPALEVLTLEALHLAAIAGMPEQMAQGLTHLAARHLVTPDYPEETVDQGIEMLGMLGGLHLEPPGSTYTLMTFGSCGPIQSKELVSQLHGGAGGELHLYDIPVTPDLLCTLGQQLPDLTRLKLLDHCTWEPASTLASLWDHLPAVTALTLSLSSEGLMEAELEPELLALCCKAVSRPVTLHVLWSGNNADAQALEGRLAQGLRAVCSEPKLTLEVGLKGR